MTNKPINEALFTRESLDRLIMQLSSNSDYRIATGQLLAADLVVRNLELMNSELGEIRKELSDIRAGGANR